MASWKVLVIGVLALCCLGLVLATAVIPLGHAGGDRWSWLAGLVAASLAACGLFALFLRYAGRELLVRAR